MIIIIIWFLCNLFKILNMLSPGCLVACICVTDINKLILHECFLEFRCHGRMLRAWKIRFVDLGQIPLEFNKLEGTNIQLITNLLTFQSPNYFYCLTQLLDDLRNRRGYWELKEEAEDRKRWRLQFIS